MSGFLLQGFACALVFSAICLSALLGTCFGGAVFLLFGGSACHALVSWILFDWYYLICVSPDIWFELVCSFGLADIMSTTQLTGLDTSQQKILGNAGPDARRMRKAIFRRTIDYNACIMNYLRDRVWQVSPRSRVALQPDYLYNYLVMLLLASASLLALHHRSFT